MNKVILITTGLFFVFNLILGMIVTCYPWFNVIMTSACLLFSCGVTIWTNRAKIDDGYRYSLLILIPILCFVEYSMAIIVPFHFTDNWILASLLALVTLEIAFLVLINFISKDTEEYEKDQKESVS